MVAWCLSMAIYALTNSVRVKGLLLAARRLLKGWAGKDRACMVANKGSLTQQSLRLCQMMTAMQYPPFRRPVTTVVHVWAPK